MKRIIAGLVFFLLASYTAAKPGGAYTLTGNERSISDIIKADMEKFPELYKGDSLSSYTTKFKRENNIGKRKLSAGDQLHFPETLTSLRAEKEAKAEGATRIKNATARKTKVKNFQHYAIPNTIRHPSSTAFSTLELWLIEVGERLVDANSRHRELKCLEKSSQLSDSPRSAHTTERVSSMAARALCPSACISVRKS